jgi:hypothetical protein
VWSVGGADELAAPLPVRELIVFADRATLHSLRRNDHLHRADVELLVVFDGDQFENAWGPRAVSGSLARRAWRPVAADLAYYDESRWGPREADGGTVVRVRRKATLIWAERHAVQ